MRKQKCHCRYGAYEIPHIKQPDKAIFRMRIKALMLNDDFKNFCSQPDIADRERDVLEAWNNYPEWAENHKEDYCLLALLFYGDIFHKEIGFTWTRFVNSINNAYQSCRPFPFQELLPGAQVPLNSITISVDPALSHKHLLRLFQGFLKMMKPVAVVRPALFEYFELQSKVKMLQAYRFIDAATCHKELKKEYPKTWKKRMTDLYKEYSSSEESKRKTIYSDIQKGLNISYWSLRGLFPKTSKPPKCSPYNL